MHLWGPQSEAPALTTSVGRDESQVKKRIFMRFLPAGRAGFFRACRILFFFYPRVILCSSSFTLMKKKQKKFTIFYLIMQKIFVINYLKNEG